MSPEQRTLLRQTFEQLMPLQRSFGLRFYQKLFELDPSIRLLFRGDADRQASMLAEALTMAVLHLLNEGMVSAEIRRLGGRHKAYGIDEEHYATFGRALGAALEERLGAGFTPAVRSAWDEAYRELSAAMQAAPAAPPARA